jgi:hypothetical protein
MLPHDWAGFANYFLEMCNAKFLNVSDQSHTMARRLLAGADLWVPGVISESMAA